MVSQKFPKMIQNFLSFQGKQGIDGGFMRGNQKNAATAIIH